MSWGLCCEKWIVEISIAWAQDLFQDSTHSQHSNIEEVWKRYCVHSGTLAAENAHQFQCGDEFRWWTRATKHYANKLCEYFFFLFPFFLLYISVDLINFRRDIRFNINLEFFLLFYFFSVCTRHLLIRLYVYIYFIWFGHEAVVKEKKIYSWLNLQNNSIFSFFFNSIFLLFFGLTLSRLFFPILHFVSSIFDQPKWSK